MPRLRSKNEKWHTRNERSVISKMPYIRTPRFFDDFPKSTTFCLICGKEIVKVGFADPRTVEVCDECKNAIELVKEWMKEEEGR